MLKSWMTIAAGEALLCTAAGAATAAPATNLAGALEGRSAVEKTARRCWWDDGVRYCTSRRGARVYGYRYSDDYRGYPRPEELPTGSAAWWRSMDYYDRGGFRR
jgi:hypothetical protein